MLRTSLALLGLLAALPAVAQERGGIGTHGPGYALGQVQADESRGCPLSNTSVTFGVNKALGGNSSAQQQLQATGGASSKCRPLVNTQVVAGVNLGLGTNANAGQVISAQGTRGRLATETYTRGYNTSYGTSSTAGQRLSNLTGP